LCALEPHPVRRTPLPEAVAGAGRSVSAAVSDAARVLAVAGCDTPRLDAELLLSHVLGVGRERLLIDPRAELEEDALERFRALVARREAREPVAYIIGRRAFRRIVLSVDRRVLIPRPETELLVEVGLTLARGARVADVGTGSGAVALALADERPDLSLVGVDLSAGAVEVARANARRLGLEVEFVRADLLDGVAGPFDAVLANLPYVAEGSGLPPEIERYEPDLALFGGPDGMDVTRRLLSMVDGVPLVALEVGLAEAVAALVSRAGFRSVERLRDLAGHERVVVGRR
jgi:release factor glutamine methyltransferase